MATADLNSSLAKFACFARGDGRARAQHFFCLLVAVMAENVGRLLGGIMEMESFNLSNSPTFY